MNARGDLMYPLKLKPIYDKTIWANDRLTKLRGIEEKGLGTCWEITAHPYARNEILNGEYQGMTLSELIEQKEHEVLGVHPWKKMLRLAYLDAKEDLSIQVHPYDEYAVEHENDNGKTESWYVLDADEGATLVAGTLTDDPEVIRKAIEDETLEKYLRKVPIQAGDFIYINAGMLHALGAGIFAIEVGTNSNTTYRFYDYGRKDENGNGRPLHLEKSFDVVDLTLSSEKIANPIGNFEKNSEKVLADSDEFQVILYDIADEMTFDTEGKDFHCLSFVCNDAEIVYNGTRTAVSYTENILIPAACGTYTIKGKCRVLKSIVK